MWRLKLTQAAIAAVIYGLCHEFLGLEPVYGYDSEANLVAMLEAAGLPTSHFIDGSGFAIRVNDYWLGINQEFNPPVDSPVLVWLGIIMLAVAFYQLIFEWDAGDNLLRLVMVQGDSKPPPKMAVPLDSYLSPHDPLWGMLSSSKAETIISVGRQLTQVPVKATIDIRGRHFENGSWYLIAAEDRSLSISSPSCFITLHEVDGKWRGWWNGDDGSQDTSHSLGFLERNEHSWSGDDIKIEVAPDPHAPVIVAEEPKEPRSLKRYAIAALGLALIVGVKIGVEMVKQVGSSTTPVAVENEMMANAEEGPTDYHNFDDAAAYLENQMYNAADEQASEWQNRTASTEPLKRPETDQDMWSSSRPDGCGFADYPPCPKRQNNTQDGSEEVFQNSSY
jgi:hypothetical protein